MTTEENNERFLNKVASYLNSCPDAIGEELVRETSAELNLSRHDAFLLLLSGALDCYGDRTLTERYLKESVRCLDPAVYEADPYRTVLGLPSAREGGWELKTLVYQPYELFVCGDMHKTFDGRILPNLGFFQKQFHYPAVFQNGREWMALKPNEIETMKKPVARAHGHTAAYGLGLGYFAFMAAGRKEVLSVTVVERDQDAIGLFQSRLLCRFPKDRRDKIRIVCADAFSYAMEEHVHDYVFADLWHDVSDGLEPYLRLKELEKAGTEYAYWIEKTMQMYL